MSFLVPGHEKKQKITLHDRQTAVNKTGRLGYVQKKIVLKHSKNKDHTHTHTHTYAHTHIHFGRHTHIHFGRHTHITRARKSACVYARIHKHARTHAYTTLHGPVKHHTTLKQAHID